MRINIERLLVVSVWLLEHGHGAHTATGGQPTKTKILLGPAHPKVCKCLAKAMRRRLIHRLAPVESRRKPQITSRDARRQSGVVWSDQKQGPVTRLEGRRVRRIQCQKRLRSENQMAVSRTALSPSYSAPRRPVNKTPGNVTIGLAAYEYTASGHTPTHNRRWSCRLPIV
jgi:hypothetical protein